ncbi:hypothetical protein GCM10010912_11880 [Paenibacillus albidus]|uniref:Branched-chain amino acid ABC transporter permease n=1 Tax=Paenibacillus albidus TaxID=2041023 RepID=A0A917FEP8_9BACL|nr:AzlC family ABC transporter permease [Paenibacillus albidus]GGF68474.1 hypothetical protein GCM10010912_11880 [Paenibacillus albidus]
MKEYEIDFRKGLADSLPIVAGFIPACFTFGIVGTSLGLSGMAVFLLSAWVFAGASQFIAVKLLAAGSSAPVLLLITLIVNLRYLFIGVSFAGKLKQGLSLPAKLGIGFTLTEEVYAVAMARASAIQGNEGKQADVKKKLPPAYLAGLQFPPYAANLLATGAGISLAGYVPSMYLPALNTSLYALLIALVVPQILRKPTHLGTCLSAAGSSWLLHPYLGDLTVLAAMSIGMIAGMFFRSGRLQTGEEYI